ncbi:MAG: hypothetical protein Q9180_003708, partial [Flavoplaca navasiana]
GISVQDREDERDDPKRTFEPRARKYCAAMKGFRAKRDVQEAEGEGRKVQWSGEVDDPTVGDEEGIESFVPCSGGDRRVEKRGDGDLLS